MSKTNMLLVYLLIISNVVSTEVDYEGFDPEEVVFHENRNISASIDLNFGEKLLQLAKERFLLIFIAIYLIATIIGVTYNYIMLKKIKSSLEKCIAEEFPNYSRNNNITRETLDSTRISLYGRKNCKGLVTLVDIVDSTG